jgi:hypothetical protein
MNQILLDGLQYLTGSDMKLEKGKGKRCFLKNMEIKKFVTIDNQEIEK